MVSPFFRQHKVFIFPFALLLLLILLTITKTSGSSVGVFNNFLFGDAQKQSELIANQPREVRSDEWEVNTPLVVSQVKNGFPRINPDIGNGQDMSLVVDVPYKEWSALFKPQNWSFFVLPLEYAFAFKWWLLGCILMISSYLFCLAMLPKKYLLASLISVGLFLSPFVQWWYSSGTILTLAYGLLIAYLGIRLFDKSLSRKMVLLWSALLAYILTCFVLIMYIPFILPVALVVAGFLIGHVVNLASVRPDRQYIKKRIIYAGGAAFIALCICFVFLGTRSSAIQAIRDTVYPGKRIDQSGGFDLRVFGGGPFNMQLQNNDKASYFPLNQSEASSFIYIFPFLLPVTVYFLLARKGGKRSTDWRMIALILISVGFLVRLFVPFSEIIFNALWLNRIPHNRLIIGLGFINIMFTVLVFGKLQGLKQKINPTILRLSFLTAFLYTLAIGLSIHSFYPGYLGSITKIVLISVIIALIVFWILKKRLVLAVTLLVFFSFVSVARVNPLYQGLSPIVNSGLSRAIQETGDNKGKWIVSEDVILENIIFANGMHALSGVYTYPQLNLWQPLERKPGDKDIYNRYAHVFFTIEKVDTSLYPSGAYLDPPALDAFRVHADPCSEYLSKQGVAYIISSHEKTGFNCLKEIKRVPYPSLTFRIYEIQ